MKRNGSILILDHCLLSLVLCVTSYVKLSRYVTSYVKLSRYVQGRDWCNYESSDTVEQPLILSKVTMVLPADKL